MQKMTIALYLQDAYLKESEAQIVRVTEEGDGMWRIVLDRTPFYPGEGGQPTDQGEIRCGEWCGKVQQVLRQQEQIVHCVKAPFSPPEQGDVLARVDWNRRYHNMRCHSAGHIIDFALCLLGLSPSPLLFMKADHGKHPFLWYKGSVEAELTKPLELKANELVQRDLKLSHHLLAYSEAKELALHLEPNALLGVSKGLIRLLTLDSIGSVADGGTQVQMTHEIGPITILQVDGTDGSTKIHYDILPIE